MLYTFRFKLQEVRKFKGMTQKRLASLANVSQSHISELERNKESPTFKIIEILADALKTYPLNLLEIDKKNH